MTARRRCTRGHFIPTDAPTDACRCALTPRPRRRRPRALWTADLWGQRLAAHQIKSIRTVSITGRYL